MAKEYAWWTCLKGIETNTYLFREYLINFFQYHLKRTIRVQREELSSKRFEKRWVNVERMAHINEKASFTTILYKQEINSFIHHYLK